ncbi:MULTISPECIES: ribosome small subunit-dependent GTPase A [Muribaculum]|uniref:ribosome small subunit-dependent GTPase A n=2 Tax=Muribaculaceae TaxID=2005473 RepID=UPI000F4823A5|nr:MULTISPECIES: ribosome small subunit-dependent GTPase A [Muribaculum]MCX4276753.1 ribosome small subunit-dependent GTPase A [Muribaculum sp.]ROT13612.1 ribosome small subunit-dependent GTPase A [Muribaculaceae bacterium Isolate-102 (HZI)]
MDGLVIKNTGSWYVVHTDNGEDVNCKIKGNFRLKGIRTTNPVAVGDRVTISVNPDGNAFITAIQPRKNYIIRRASNLSKESHIIAANLDCAFLVVTLAHPVTSTTFIDRFLATAEAYRVPAVLLINKVDLLTDDDDKEYCEAVASLYRTIGYDVLEISALTGEGMTELRERLKDKISLFSGNSGVGKSTIINALLPDLELRTGSISDMHDTGMHTTTFSEMFPLPEGGWIIDTPGIKGFGTIDFDKHEIAHFFPEIFKISAECKYGDCTHTHEPGCAVLKALDDHYISQSRYASYLSILDDTNPDKYRKPF